MPNNGSIENKLAKKQKLRKSQDVDLTMLSKPIFLDFITLIMDSIFLIFLEINS